MRKYFPILLCVVAVIAAGAAYYYHQEKVPPPPKDLSVLFSKAALDKITPEQRAVLRGEAASAPLVSKVATEPRVHASAPAPTALATGLTVTLTSDGKGSLRGKVANATKAPVTYSLPAGMLLSNGDTEVVLLKAFSGEVPPEGSLPLLLPVAQTALPASSMEGAFVAHAGSVEDLKPLLDLLATKENFAPNAAQAAVLILSSDAPLEALTDFPSLRPLASPPTEARLAGSSPTDLITALGWLQEAGVDLKKFALPSDPQLQMMTMLSPEAHAAALGYFALTSETEWAYWKSQLLEGDPTLRHYALYGIASYFPEVGLQMLPRWVRETRLPRTYRYAAAAALALIKVPEARDELQQLQVELTDDAGLRKEVNYALDQWAGGTSKTAAAAKLDSAPANE